MAVTIFYIDTVCLGESSSDLTIVVGCLFLLFLRISIFVFVLFVIVIPLCLNCDVVMRPKGPYDI